MSVDLEELKYSGMNLGAVEARADLMSGSEWRVRVGGTNADGTVTIDTEGAAGFMPTLKSCTCPPMTGQVFRPFSPVTDAA